MFFVQKVIICKQYSNTIKWMKMKVTFLLLFVFQCVLIAFVNSEKVDKVKGVHVILRDKVMCIDVSFANEVFERDILTPEKTNIWVKFYDHQHNSTQINLQKFDRCHSRVNEFNYFLCGTYDDALPWDNTNTEHYRMLKVVGVSGYITFKKQSERIIYLNQFYVRPEHIQITEHLHGYDPCRNKTTANVMCPTTCHPSCGLYTLGDGTFRCDKKDSRYYRDQPYDMELYKNPFTFAVQQLHKEENGRVLCIQLVTNVGSHCYVDHFKHNLMLRQKHTGELVESYEAVSMCEPLFFKDNFPGSFCFQLNRDDTWTDFAPTYLVLHNLTIYCDNFTIRKSNNIVKFALEKMETKQYDMLKIYDICPHAIKEKGGMKQRRGEKYHLHEGFLIESLSDSTPAASSFSFATVSVIAAIIIILIVSVSVFFIVHSKKRNSYEIK